MKTFLCQMPEHDDADDWTEVKAWTNEDAATRYAELCDSRSGGELFDEPDCKQTILVKYGEHPTLSFEVAVDFTKIFLPRQLAEAR